MRAKLLAPVPPRTPTIRILLEDLSRRDISSDAKLVLAVLRIDCQAGRDEFRESRFSRALGLDGEDVDSALDELKELGLVSLE